MRERGTAMSSEILCGLSATQRGARPMRRAAQSFSRCASSWATSVSLAPVLRSADLPELGELGEDGLVDVAVDLGEHRGAGAGWES